MIRTGCFVRLFEQGWGQRNLYIDGFFSALDFREVALAIEPAWGLE